jgi:hypothetical protein
VVCCLTSGFAGRTITFALTRCEAKAIQVQAPKQSFRL